MYKILTPATHWHPLNIKLHVELQGGAMYGVIKRRCDNPATHWRPKINIRHASPWSSIRDLGATSKSSPFRPFGPSGSTAAFGRWCIEDLGLRPRILGCIDMFWQSIIPPFSYQNDGFFVCRNIGCAMQKLFKFQK